MMNLVLSYQCCVAPMIPRRSLSHVVTLGSCTKKTNLCFSTPLLLGRKMHSINRSSSSLLASPSKVDSHPLMMIPSDEKEEDGRSICRFYDYVNENVVNTNIKIPEEVDHAIYLGSSHGWLAYISHLDCSVFLWSPFTTSPLITLPPIHTPPFITAGGLFPKMIEKVVLTSVPTSDDCIVVAPSNLTRYKGIFFCKPRDKSWTFVKEPNMVINYRLDVTHFRDQLFYTMDYCGDTLFAYDLADLSSPKSYLLKPAIDERMRSYFVEPFFQLKPSLEEYNAIYHLVESLGDLLLICRLIRRDIYHQWYDEEDIVVFSDDDEFPIEKFEVYRLDFFRNTWEHAKCIGDQVLFLDNNQTLSLSAIEFPSLKANCIYFTGDSYRCHNYGHCEQGGPVFGQFRCFGDGFEPFWVMRHFH
jgi:hypothetical protein